MIASLSVFAGRCLSVVGLVLSLVLGACGAPQGKHVRFAELTAAEFQALENEEVVWFEFRAGDQVPMVFVLTGMAESATERPIVMRAKRDFWIVISKRDQKQYYSFDGKTLVSADNGKYGILLGADEKGPQVGLLLFIGEAQDMPEELR